ncbi:MAG: 3-oxoacyl-ACP reductase FabG [Thiohalomonadaceae bacterium]|jgi:3-oxoacyl-[acyl-carrier protein] reductase
MKKALVTGGSGDIGAAICRHLAVENIEVLVHANKNSQRAEELCAAIKSAGGQARSLLFDVTDAEQCRETLTAEAEISPIQILVNNAGIHADAPMAGMSLEQWREVIEVSLHGFYNVTQPLLLPMMATRWGRIINLSSVAGVMGNRGQTNYAAAKAALHGASKSLALELASRGVTVNVVAPGVIAGKMTDEIFSKDAIKSLVPMKRAGQAEEVAALVGFLASDNAAYISGQIIGINGAMA